MRRNSFKSKAANFFAWQRIGNEVAQKVGDQTPLSELGGWAFGWLGGHFECVGKT